MCVCERVCVCACVCVCVWCVCVSECLGDGSWVDRIASALVVRQHPLEQQPRSTRVSALAVSVIYPAVYSSLIGFTVLSGHLMFTVRHHQFNTDSRCIE